MLTIGLRVLLSDARTWKLRDPANPANAAYGPGHQELRICAWPAYMPDAAVIRAELAI